jgi:hypothetical protein
MKKLLILTSLLVFTGILTAQTQPTSSSDTYSNLFKVSASMFTRNTFQMEWEHYFKPTTSFQINAGMNFRDTDYEQLWGINTEAQMKFHVFTQINPKNSHRLYFAPYLLYNYEELKESQYVNPGHEIWIEDSFGAIGTGVVFGWSFSFANRINLDIFTGGGIRKSFNVDSDLYSDVWDYSYSGIAPPTGRGCRILVLKEKTGDPPGFWKCLPFHCHHNPSVSNSINALMSHGQSTRVNSKILHFVS